MLRLARLRRQPGQTVYEVAKRVALVTADDFMKKGAPLESDFVMAVHRELVHLEGEHRARQAALDELQEISDNRATPVEAVFDWASPAPIDSALVDDDNEYESVETFFDEFDTEPDAGSLRRHWRVTYELLTPIERRVFLVGVAGSGVVLVSIVSAITQALL